MNDDIFFRLIDDMFENARKMAFIRSMTGLTEEQVLELPDDEFEKYHDTYDRSKNWKKN